MKKAAILSLALVVGAFFLTGCIPKEIRTIRIELGTRNKPKQNPDMPRVKDNLNKALELYPDNPEVYYLWGWVSSIEENYKEMDRYFKKSLELSPKFQGDIDTIRMTDSDKLVNKARDAYQNENFEEAYNIFLDAIICWPSRLDPYLFGANAAHRIGKLDEAYDLGKKAYEIAPDSSTVIEVFATICLAKGKNDEAEALFLKLYEKDPTNTDILFRLGDLYRVKGDTARAREYWEILTTADPEHVDGWFNLGLLYFQIKDFCKSAVAFERVSTLIPEDIDSKINYFTSLVQCGKLPEAKSVLEQFTMEHSDNCDGWDLLSQTYLRLQMTKEANQAFEKYQKCKGE
jgi:tetratricopeptide (TPR) repeat protein